MSSSVGMRRITRGPFIAGGAAVAAGALAALTLPSQPVAVPGAAAVAGGLTWAAILRRRRYRRRSFRQLPPDDPAVVSLCSELRLREPWPRFGGWAVTPDFARLLLRLVRDSESGRVLELGSGTSSVVIAAALREAGGGRLVSIDHAESFARATRDLLVAQGLDGGTKVVVAPLGGEPVWYDRDTVARASAAGTWDLVVVDGPSCFASGLGTRCEVRFVRRS